MLHKDLILTTFSEFFISFHNEIIETDIKLISIANSELKNYQPEEGVTFFIELIGTSHIYLIVNTQESVIEKAQGIDQSNSKNTSKRARCNRYILPTNEVMNTVSGQLLDALQVGGQLLSTRPPKAVVGLISLPNLQASISTCQTNYGEFTFAVCIDLMQNKLQRQLTHSEALTKAKSQFIANMTHEFRTPLNSIMGFAQLLQRRKDVQENERFTKYLSAIEHNSSNLLDLINSTLDMSTIDIGTLSLFKRPTNIAEILRNVVDKNTKKSEQKGLLISSFGIDESIDINIDSERVTQILQSLVSNAIKCTEQGSIVITMEVLTSAKLFIKNNIPALAISIADTGSGISPKDIEKLFLRLTQIDESSTRKIAGVGLGLSISMALANLHGGTITVESVVEEGSIFTLLLPFDSGTKNLSVPDSSTITP